MASTQAIKPDLASSYWVFSYICRMDQLAILAARKRGDMEQATSYITNELVALFSASGSPTEFQDHLRAYLDSGIDLAVLKLLGTPDQRLQALRLAIEVAQSPSV
ncbi:MAG: hypothetical protein A2Z14_18085 [Chloroflexi bacterium RBG_16_48_8]|nr:MAG: hypothetical protein A2Z14_18085 [Chloroflexi bacterium RBG_16_48_8]